MVKTKYQFIFNRNKEIEAVEILIDMADSKISEIIAKSKKFSLTDITIINHHVKNIYNEIVKWTPEEIELLKNITLHINIVPTTLKALVFGNPSKGITCSLLINKITGLPFKKICFEVIEEEIFNNDFFSLIEKTKSFSPKIIFGIDDFGTGGMTQQVFSAIEYFEVVKFDYPSFTDHLDILYYYSLSSARNGKINILEKKFYPDNLNIGLFQTFELHFPQPLEKLKEDIVKFENRKRRNNCVL